MSASSVRIAWFRKVSPCVALALLPWSWQCGRVSDNVTQPSFAGGESAEDSAPVEAPELQGETPPEDSEQQGEGQPSEIPEVPPLDPVVYGSGCPERRRPHDDPGAAEQAQERGLELQQVLARVVGEHTSTLRWSTPTDMVNAAPESGDVPVSIRVVYLGGAATFVDGYNELGPIDPETSSCRERLEVEVEVEVQTGEGALNERFEAVLAMEQHIGEIRHRLELGSLAGSLSLSPPPPDGPRRVVLGSQLNLSMQVSELGTSGALWVQAREFTNGVDTTSVPDDGSALERFARWPSVNECSYPHEHVAPFEVSFAEVSPARVLGQVVGQNVPFTWDDGTQTTLVMSPGASAPTGCAGANDDAIFFSFDVEVAAATGDGGVQALDSTAVRLIRHFDRVTAVFEMGPGSVARDELVALLPTTPEASRYDGGYVEFDVSHHFAWPTLDFLGSEGRFSVTVVDPECDTDECDGFPLIQGAIPPEAAPPEPPN